MVGILYPLRYYKQVNGFNRTKEDFAYIKELLIKYGLEKLPILDHTDGFKFLDDEPTNNMIITRRM